eukprot:691141-Alexandrium_andersonii.AAC.1
MSASLVGSEMCIRDRFQSVKPKPSVSATASGRISSGRPVAASRPFKRGTVSYTHLTLPTICSV